MNKFHQCLTKGASRRFELRREHQPAEVVVFSQEDSVFGQCQFHQVFVDGTMLKFVYSQNIMASRPKRTNRGEMAALIREKAHSPDLSRAERQNGFMGEPIGYVLQRSADVVRAQSRVCVQQLIHRPAFGELAKQKLYRNPRAAYHWLALLKVHPKGMFYQVIRI